MIILSNGFPTNMPNSEQVSQGGPANFAKLFSSHIASSTKHKWLGIMFHRSSSSRVRLNKVFSFKQRDYFKIYLPIKFFRDIMEAKKNVDPAQILRTPIRRMVSFIKKEKPDVVFLNGFGLFNWVLLKAAEQAGVPVVIQHAGIWTKELRLHRHLYSETGLKIMEQMERDSTRLTSSEVFLNTWSRDYYSKNVAKRTDSNGVVIPLPFDFQSFKLTANRQRKSIWTNSKKFFKVGTIARWDRIKNHRAILPLAKAVTKNKLNWKFFSVTKISDESNYLKGKKADYKKHVTVIPSLNRTGISDFCRHMDLLILPSLFDVSPTVVLEAVAADTPIIISENVGYVHDFLRNGAGDWVIDFKDIGKTLKAVKKIAGKPLPDLLKRQIISNHDYRKVFSEYLNLFNRIVFSKLKPISAPSLKVPMDVVRV